MYQILSLILQYSGCIVWVYHNHAVPFVPLQPQHMAMANSQSMILCYCSLLIQTLTDLARNNEFMSLLNTLPLKLLHMREDV